MRCRCGAANCRGLLTFADYRDPAWRAKYQGHWTEYIQKKVEEVTAAPSASASD
jgi:hypothetical protein